MFYQMLTEVMFKKWRLVAFMHGIFRRFINGDKIVASSNRWALKGGTTLLSDWVRRSGFFSYFEIGCLLCEEASSFP